MKALVLTFDKYKDFAIHMILCYEEVWKDNPFVFRIPYQDDKIKKEYESKFGNKVELIKSPSGIVDTMFSLTEDLDSDEWVYWCMDDRYPIRIDMDELIKCYQFAMDEKRKGISGVMFCNNPRIWIPTNRFGKDEDISTEAGQIYHRRKNYTMIWNHQFLRVKVVRDFFSLFPRNMKQAKEMDPIKDNAQLPSSQHLYFLDKNIALYGESTNRGIMTKNCAESFRRKNIPLPENFSISEQVIIKGNTGKWDNEICLLRYYVKQLLNNFCRH